MKWIVGLALALALCVVGRAEAAITVSQQCYTENANTGATVSCGVTPAVGQIVYVSCTTDGATGATRTITDGVHDAAFATNLLDAGSQSSVGQWVSWVVSTTGSSITIVCTAGGNFYGAIEVAFLSSNATWDANGSFATGTGDVAVSATLSASGVVIGTFVHQGGAVITEDGTLLQEQQTYTNTTGGTQYKSGSGSLTLNWDLDTDAGAWRGVAIAFTETGGSGGPTCGKLGLLGVGC